MIQYTEDEIKNAISYFEEEVRTSRRIALKELSASSREHWELRVVQEETRITELKAMLGVPNETGLNPITIDTDAE